MKKIQQKFNTFDDFCNNSPIQIRYYLEHSKSVPQTSRWHPEGDLYNHIKIVFNRAKKIGNINLILAAILHDLGKVDTTTKHPTIADKWSSKFHEKVSGKITKDNREWIESLGADFDIVFYLVDQHMRIKQFDEMRESKKRIIMNHPFYTYLEQFTEMDDMLTDYSNDIN